MANSRSVLIEKVEALTQPVLEEHRMELVDLEFIHEHGQWVLRFYLDRAGGITLDDCAVLNDHLGRVLDAADPIAQSYALEVSSPGVYRPLRKPGDFERFKGERVDIKLYAPIEGRRHFHGTISEVHDGHVTVDEEGKRFVLPFAGIAKARLDPEIEI